jgi:hypothetical protein
LIPVLLQHREHGLRVTSIYLDKDRLQPGETLSGQVTIRTSKSFECNRVILKIIGKERTERPAGDTNVVEEKHHIDTVFTLSEGGVIPEGVSRFPFSFRLPSSLLPSYHGRNGIIDYSVRSVVEVNWALDPTSEESFFVLQEGPPSLHEIFDVRRLNQTSGHLHIKLDSNAILMNRGIRVRFMVSERPRVKGVRFEILKKEEALCQHHVVTNDETVAFEFYPISPADFESWKEVQVGETLDCHLPFRGELISVSYFLKVSLDVSLGRDPDVVIPLRFSEDVPVEDVLDEIERDLWRI